MKKLEALILAGGLAFTSSCGDYKNTEIPEECHLRCNVTVPAYCGPLLYPDECPSPDAGGGVVRIDTCPLIENKDGTYTMLCGHVPVDGGSLNTSIYFQK